MQKKLISLTILSAFASLQASAAIIPNVELITDGSFENVSDPFGGGNANRLSLDSWFEINDDGDSAADDNTFTEAAQGGGVNNTPAADDGGFWLNLAPRSGTNPAAVYQQLGTWNTGNPTEFNFSAVLGDRSNTAFGSLTFELYKTNAGESGADGTALSGLAGAAQVANFGTFDSTGLSNGGTLGISATNVTATGLSDGDLLWMRISSTTVGDQSLVDSVSVTAIPEPGTLALVGIALGGLLLFRRRR